MSTKLKNLLKNFRNSFKKKMISVKNNGQYSYKGSGYRGSGKINTDTSTFNKLRK